MLRFISILSLLATLIPAAAPAAQAAPAARRINAPFFEGEVNWDTAGMAWFGRVDVSASAGAAIPGRNYADVRVAYTPQALRVFVSIVDYYLWKNENPAASLDQVTAYDALALYLDTGGDRAAQPGQDDYYFVSGFGEQRHQGRGGPGGWDRSWGGVWAHGIGAQWSQDPGPNENGGTLDYGWATTITVPWSTLGLGGPPHGQVLGMGIELFDRDSAQASGIAPVQSWPEQLDADQPATWGELRLGAPSYQLPLAAPEGSVTIARGLPGASVVDATVGANGNCVNGHEGEPDTFNQGSDTSLFVASQSAVTDFPCFARSYLRFELDQIPSGKVIVNATLTLHHWSQSGSLDNPNPDDRPRPSYVQLFTVDGGWTEEGVTWNNSPRARENLGGVWVEPRPPTDQLFPGVPYSWDATSAVASAYAAGQPLDIALYTADTHQHSNKFFTSSDTGDWNAVARPTLVVTWGVPSAEAARVYLPLVQR